jgi:hypothetical protein
MHVVGKLKPAVAKASAPLSFYKTRPDRLATTGGKTSEG